MTRNTLVAVLALTTAGLLSGCAGAQPGVAAQVGDETIQVSDVNRLSDGYCAAYERQLEGDGTVLPMEVVTSNVVQTLTMTAVARQLAEEHGVEPSTTYEQNLANLEQAGDALADDAGEAKVTIESGLAYVNDILEQVGRKTLAEDGVTDPTVEDATARGKELLSTWIAVNEPEIDPQYGLKLVELQPEYVDTAVSFPVSDSAKGGALAPGDEDQAAYARTLPDSQRCG